jgi:hypothetical protein
MLCRVSGMLGTLVLGFCTGLLLASVGQADQAGGQVSCWLGSMFACRWYADLMC